MVISVNEHTKVYWLEAFLMHRHISVRIVDGSLFLLSDTMHTFYEIRLMFVLFGSMWIFVMKIIKFIYLLYVHEHVHLKLRLFEGVEDHIILIRKHYIVFHIIT